MQEKHGFPKWFLPIVLIIVITAGISCVRQYIYLFDKNSTQKQTKRLKAATTEIADVIEKDGHFAELIKWVIENQKNIEIPVDFKNALQKSEQKFNDYMKERYSKNDLDMFVAGNRRLFDLDEEAQKLYANYKMEYWYNVFAEAKENYDLNNMCFLYPLEDKKNTVVSLIDPNNINIGEAFINIYKEKYLDPKEYEYLWQTWEYGKATNSFDTGKSLSYTRPITYKDNKIGLIQAIA